MVAQLRMALGQRGEQDVAALAPRRVRAAVLARVHPLVGEAQRLADLVRVVRDRDRAVRRADGEALTALGERGRGLGRRGLRRPTRPGPQQRAELVTAHAVGGALAGDPAREALGEAHEQR
ncbi:MAG TPA: hypothetical protein VFG79_17855, partial [Solirubrobacter sp.]|nr:hypothetical protein [Solirubrobacter sp.]